MSDIHEDIPLKEDLKPSGVLDRAADLMEERGWHRRGLLDPVTGAMCHLGAIYAASGYDRHIRSPGGTWRHEDGPVPRPEGALMWDREAIKSTDIAVVDIAYWNDYRCKSKRQAVATLREAARMAREAGE